MVSLDLSVVAVSTSDPKDPIINGDGEDGIGGKQVSSQKSRSMYVSDIFQPSDIDFNNPRGTVF
ncbi:MAG: hypothetical protein Q4C30_08675 [Bacteroidia bacterium]|nr:hypothetical protein [Bacteroidia bacterium]